MNNFVNFYKILIFKDFYLFVIWFFILSGINVNIDYLIIDNNQNILSWIYSFRAYVQFIILPFLFYKNLDFFNNIKKINYFFFLFFLYNLIQILSLFLSENNNLNIIYNVCALNVLLFLNIIFTKKNYEIKKIFYIFILLITLVYLFFYFEKIYYLIFEDQIFYGHYGYNSLLAPIHNIPRSSGLGRMALIIFLFIIIFFKSNSIKNKFILTVFIIPGIFLTQSRTVIGIYLIVLFIFSFSKYFNLNNLHFRNLIYNIIYLILIPLLFSIFLSQLKMTNTTHLKYTFEKYVLKKEVTLNKPYKKYKILRDINPASISSYRYDHWKELINKSIVSSPFIGNGTQADRFLINQTASNGLIYFFSSSGIIGIVIYFMILIYIIKIFLSRIKNIQEKTLINKNFIFSLFIILTFVIRSLVETSYAVFSIDYILFIISLFILNHEKKSKN